MACARQWRFDVCVDTRGVPSYGKAITKRVPRRVVDKIVAEGQERTVGGATSIGAAHRRGFDLFYAVEPVTPGQPAARRIFNGLDLDSEVGQVGQYVVTANGIA
jgi:hypothetical protein